MGVGVFQFLSVMSYQVTSVKRGEFPYNVVALPKFEAAVAKQKAEIDSVRVPTLFYVFATFLSTVAGSLLAQASLKAVV